MRVEHTAQFRCTPQHLWPFLEEPERQKQWMKGLLENRRTEEGPPGVGSKFRMKIKEGFKVAEYDGEVTGYDPPRHLGVRLWGGGFPEGMAMRVDYRLSEVDGGTRMDYVAQTESAKPLPWWMRLLMPLFKVFGKMQLKGFLKTLKRLAEAHPA